MLLHEYVKFFLNTTLIFYNTICIQVHLSVATYLLKKGCGMISFAGKWLKNLVKPMSFRGLSLLDPTRASPWTQTPRNFMRTLHFHFCYSPGSKYTCILYLQVIDFQKACLTKQNYSVGACMYQFGYLKRNELIFSCWS